MEKDIPTTKLVSFDETFPTTIDGDSKAQVYANQWSASTQKKADVYTASLQFNRRIPTRAKKEVRCQQN